MLEMMKDKYIYHDIIHHWKLYHKNIIKFGIADFEMITNSPIQDVQLHVAGYFFD